MRCCRATLPPHVLLGQRKGPFCCKNKHVVAKPQRRFAVSSAVLPESREQTAIDWAKRPEGGKPVREFLENKRRQPRKPKLNHGMERLIKVLLCIPSWHRTCHCKLGVNKRCLFQVLAATGISTYKKSHAVILAGRVKVNGKIVKQPTHLVNPVADEIYIHGSLVKPKQQHKYIVLNKRAGIACSTLVGSLNRQESEPSPLKKIQNAAEGSINSQKLFLASRLDSGSCGLQLITTDPDWAERVTRSAEGKHTVLHAPQRRCTSTTFTWQSYSCYWCAVQQEYIATVSSCPENWQLDQMVRGCAAEVHSVKPVHASVLNTARHPTFWRIRLVVEKARARNVRHLINNAGAKTSQLNL